MGMLLLNSSTDLNPRELFANNEQGLWLDPSDMTAGKAGWRRNLLTYSEGLVTQFGLTDQVTNASTSISGFSNSIQFGNNSVLRYCYNVYTTILNASYTVSVFVQMDDDSIPSVGSSTTTGDFSLIAVNSILSGVTVSLVSGSTYRISKTFTGDGASRNIGIIKYTGQSAKTFRVTGYQLELGSLSEYQKITDFSTEFKAAFPTHTLYQDSNAVTPCTAAGDPVGLILDQSRGGLSQIGADLVTNGTFAADSDWTKGANWTIGSGVATKTGGGANNLTQTIGSTAAAWYRISLDVTRSAGTLTVSLGTSGTSYAITATGSYTFFILAGSGTQTLTLAGDSSFAGTVDNVVVKNVPGNHAYQTTSASRPTLARIPSSGRRNLLTRTEEFDNAAWTVSAASVSQNTLATTDPIGTNTADKLIENAANTRHEIYQTFTATAQPYTFSVYAKAAERSRVALTFAIGGSTVGATYDLTSSGSVVAFDGGVTATISSVGNGWFRCVMTVTATAAAHFPAIRLVSSGTTQLYLGDGSSGVYLWGAQLETGSSATNYQKVVATTDVTESGFGDLWHLVFDGSDDSLVTNAVDMTGTAQITVIAGVRKIDTTARMICELSTNATTAAGAFYLLSGQNATDGWWSQSKGDAVSVVGHATNIATSAIETAVVSTTHDLSGDITTIRRNSVAGSDATADKGSGNFRNDVLYIGRRGGSSLPYNGHLYQLIIRGKTTPTGKLLEAERFVARKTGVSF